MTQSVASVGLKLTPKIPCLQHEDTKGTEGLS